MIRNWSWDGQYLEWLQERDLDIGVLEVQTMEAVLVTAVCSNSQDIIYYLLDRDIDIQITEPILIAALRHSSEATCLIRTLLARGPDIKVPYPF